VNLEALEPQARDIIRRYDQRRAAVLPLLWLVQENFGYVSSEAEFWVGRLVGIAVSHVREVVSFYTMFYRKPVGRWHLEVCTNLSCRLRGADKIVDCVRKKLGIEPGQTTPDRKFTLTRVECLASCGTAPMLQLNHEGFHENLTVESTAKLIDELSTRDD